MGTELRYPNWNARTESEKQLQSYLHQLIDQLQFALDNVGGASSTTYVQTAQRNTNQSSSGGSSSTVDFESLKALIIKSADIVDAYYQEISKRLEGYYVAESDFGTFVQTTEQRINETSQYTEQLFSNYQEILTDIENLNFYSVKVDAHIKAGLLEEVNGVPVYGLEIGQKNTIDGEEVFNKYARFTAERLSFYDQNDTEVAYISDNKLYIRNVEVANSYKIGGYVDTVTSGGGVITKWVGGDS